MPRARAALLAAVTALAGCAGAGDGGRCGPAEGRVAHVIDGDTIDLEGGERVRYLLVDAPENTGETECFGAEATLFNEELVSGAVVRLTYAEECTDDYGRLLAYVAVQGREINSLLVERGFGCALYIPPNGADRRGEFEDLEAHARGENRGLWGACRENPCN